MKQLLRALAGLVAPRPTYTIRRLTPAQYLRERAAGADLVRVEGERRH